MYNRGVNLYEKEDANNDTAQKNYVVGKDSHLSHDSEEFERVIAIELCREKTSLYLKRNVPCFGDLD